MKTAYVSVLLFVFTSGYYVKAEEMANIEDIANEENVYDVPTRYRLKVHLSCDAEYMGALLDSSVFAEFYETGKICNATLKEDYKVGDIIYKAGERITFTEDGSVNKGILKENASIDDLVFMKNNPIYFHNNGKVKYGYVKSGGRPNNLNLVIPCDASITFSKNGYIEKFTMLADHGEVLGLKCKGVVYVVYDKKEDSYKLYRGEPVNPQIIAMLTTARNEIGGPTAAEAVIVPALSQFYYYTSNPDYTLGGQAKDTWDVQGRYVINGYDMGISPQLHIRNRSLYGIKLNQDVVLDGHQFRRGQVVRFNSIGKITIP